MTLNILFFTITIKKRLVTAEDVLREEMARKLYEKNKERQVTIHRW